MKNRRIALLAALAVAVLAAPTRTVAAGSESELYARMQKVNAGLTSYQADVTAAVVTHGFPYLNPTLQGHAYFKRPDKNAVIFDTLPIIAQQIKHVVATIEPPSEWPSVYDVTPTGDDGNAGTFRLVRKKNGRIDHIDVKVDEKTATVIGMTYYYKDGGGTIAVTQTYDDINGNFVVKTQTGKVDIPHYSADVTSTFGNYKLNVPVDDRVFESS